MSIPQFLLKYCEQKNLKSTDTTKFIFQIHYGCFKHAQSLTQMCSMMTAKLSNKWDMSKMSPRVEAEVSLTVSWLCGLVAKLGFLSRRTFLASTFRHDHNWWNKKTTLKEHHSAITLGQVRGYWDGSSFEEITALFKRKKCTDLNLTDQHFITMCFIWWRSWSTLRPQSPQGINFGKLFWRKQLF